MAEKVEDKKPDTVFQRFKDAMERIQKNRRLEKEDLKALLDAKKSDLKEYTQKKSEEEEKQMKTVAKEKRKKPEWQERTGKTSFENLNKDDFTEIVSSEIWEWIKDKGETGHDKDGGASGGNIKEEQKGEKNIKKED